MESSLRQDEANITEAASDPASPIPNRGRARTWAVGISSLIVVGVVAIGVWGWRSRTSLVSADYVHGPNAVPGLSGTLELALGSYTELIRLVVLSFGVVAFLVTYQLEKGVVPSHRAWAVLGLGLAFLAGALGLALLGSDTILYMMSQNAVDLGFGMLQTARLLMYVFLVVAFALILGFATQVALALPEGRVGKENRP